MGLRHYSVTLTVHATKTMEAKMEENNRVGVYHKSEIWTEDIMDYFGEFIEEGEVSELLKMARYAGGEGYFETMHEIRRILLERGFSVPFRSVYRRTKR